MVGQATQDAVLINFLAPSAMKLQVNMDYIARKSNHNQFIKNPKGKGTKPKSGKGGEKYQKQAAENSLGWMVMKRNLDKIGCRNAK